MASVTVSMRRVDRLFMCSGLYDNNVTFMQAETGWPMGDGGYGLCEGDDRWVRMSGWGG
jgi:hypothetical protein